MAWSRVTVLAGLSAVLSVVLGACGAGTQRLDLRAYGIPATATPGESKTTIVETSAYQGKSIELVLHDVRVEVSWDGAARQCPAADPPTGEVITQETVGDGWLNLTLQRQTAGFDSSDPPTFVVSGCRAGITCRADSTEREPADRAFAVCKSLTRGRPR